MGVGLAVAALGHVMGAPQTYHTLKSFHKPLTYTQTLSAPSTKRGTGPTQTTGAP